MKKPMKATKSRRKARRPFPTNWTKSDRAGWTLLQNVRKYYKLMLPEIERLIGWKGRSPSVKDVNDYRKKISQELVDLLLDYRSAQEKPCPLPSGLSKERGPKRHNYNFINALGIDEAAWQISIKKYRGKYLHFTLNDADNVVTSKVDLTRDLASDHAPIYTSSRNIVTKTGTTKVWKFLGAYFTNGTHLFLIGSRTKLPDARLSLFDVDFESDEPQVILRGSYLGVSSQGTVLSSRCMLMPLSLIPAKVHDKLFERPQSRAAVQEMTPPPLKQVVSYLYGVEKLHFIKVAMGS